MSTRCVFVQGVYLWSLFLTVFDKTLHLGVTISIQKILKSCRTINCLLLACPVGWKWRPSNDLYHVSTVGKLGCVHQGCLMMLKLMIVLLMILTYKNIALFFFPAMLFDHQSKILGPANLNRTEIL